MMINGDLPSWDSVSVLSGDELREGVLSVEWEGRGDPSGLLTVVSLLPYSAWLEEGEVREVLVDYGEGHPFRHYRELRRTSVHHMVSSSDRDACSLSATFEGIFTITCPCGICAARDVLES